MDKRCRGCIKHNKGREGTKYVDWCCKYSNVARHIVGHCKMNNGKVLAHESQ